MNINQNWATFAMETEAESMNDGELVDRLYEMEVQAKSNPDKAQELEDVRREIDQRGIIAKKYSGNDLFKEEMVKEEGWAANMEVEDEDVTQLGMFKNAEFNDPNLRKIPDSVLKDSYYLLKEKKDQGITNLTDDSSLAELENEMKRREITASAEGIDNSKLIENWQGLSDGMGEKEIADKHSKPVEDVIEQLKAGIEVEMEHTNDEELARKIALDHLFEDIDYYKKLRRIESICDHLEENRYYCGDSDAVIEKTASELHEDIIEVQKIYFDRYMF